MDETTRELYQLVNAHTKEISELSAEQKAHGVRLHHIEGDHSYICDTLKKTETNMTKMFNDRMDELSNSLQELVAQKHRKEGEDAALLRTRQDDIDKFNIRVKLFNLIPDALKMLGYLAIGYALIQQINPHK